jgi:nicotinate phosphoribosyltransferase
VGTALVTGSGYPTCGLVYKLVAREVGEGAERRMVPIAKKSKGKVSVGGRKYAARRLDDRGVADVEMVGIGAPPEEGKLRPLLVPLVRSGEVVGREPLAAARNRHAESREELPLPARQLSRGEPVIPTEFVG